MEKMQSIGLKALKIFLALLGLFLALLLIFYIYVKVDANHIYNGGYGTKPIICLGETQDPEYEGRVYYSSVFYTVTWEKGMIHRLGEGDDIVIVDESGKWRVTKEHDSDKDTYTPYEYVECAFYSGDYAWDGFTDKSIHWRIRETISRNLPHWLIDVT